LVLPAYRFPTWDSRCIDLQKAAESKTYADEIKGLVNAAGLEITELSTHLQGQLVAVNLLMMRSLMGLHRKTSATIQSKNRMGRTAIEICRKSF
jgi:sugar phosphate isomerase/epimerase